MRSIWRQRFLWQLARSAGTGPNRINAHAGFVAVAADPIMPGVATSTRTIFLKIASVISRSATQGS